MAAPDGALRQRARWQSIGTILLVLVLSAVTWTGALVLRNNARAMALSGAQVQAENLATNIADEVTRTLDGLDVTLDPIVQELRADPNRLAQIETWDAPLNALRGVAFVTVATRDGRPLGDSARGLAHVPEPVLRAHANWHAAATTSGLLVGRSMVDRTTRQTTLPISRRLETATRHYLGIVVVSMVLDAFGGSLPSLDLGPRGVVALVGTDGSMRALLRAPKPEIAPGAGQGQDLSPLEAPFEAAAAERVLASRSIASQGLAVLVSPDPDAVLGLSRLQGRLLVLGAAFATLTWIGLGALALSGLRGRTHLALQLADERREADARLAAERAALAATRRALAESRTHAEAATLAKVRFLARMSHELRPPLHAMIGASEVIRDQAPADAAPPLHAYAQQIGSASRGLLELINATLEFARIEGGSAQLVEAVVRVTDLVRGAVGTVQPQAEARGVTLRADLPDRLPALRADPGRLRQILMNLLSNAARFGQPGSVATISAAETDAGGLAISVADGGEGMSPREIAVALEPFGQVDASLARPEAGAGLGLRLAKALAELHGGTLRVESRKGEGTRVEVVFPAERVLRELVA
ncbi:MAG: sensor histidine kinase [Rhodospirillales bacterium]|nr:sensor histidine kinase [Rhodospirillales bacterium]